MVEEESRPRPFSQVTGTSSRESVTDPVVEQVMQTLTVGARSAPLSKALMTERRRVKDVFWGREMLT